jgi:hypothetical protein
LGELVGHSGYSSMEAVQLKVLSKPPEEASYP